MAKRKKIELPPSVIKFSIVLFLAFFLGLGVYRAIENLLTQASFFRIKAVVIDSSLQFIDRRDLVRLTGKNIFTVDLKDVQRQLGLKYPQVSQIKVVRRFPDQVQVVARKRTAMAQAVIKNKTLTLDENGVVLATTGNLDRTLPLILGISYSERVALGWPIYSKELRASLKIIKTFKTQPTFRNYNILKINVESLSKIEFYLTPDLSIIVDADHLENKIDVLAMILSQGQLNFKQVKYIDLRFKEPMIGRKNVSKN